MDFQKIKKVLFNKTSFYNLPEEEKKIASRIIIGVVFFIFFAMFITGYIISPSNFWEHSSNGIGRILEVGLIIYLAVQLYNAIQAVMGNREDFNEALKNQKGQDTVKIFINVFLPLVLIYFLEQYWLKK